MPHPPAATPHSPLSRYGWTTIELTFALAFLWLMAGLPGLGQL
jgi:hypothetical protein